MATSPIRARLANRLMVVALALCCIALTSCTAFAIGDTTSDTSSVTAAPAPAMDGLDSISATPESSTGPTAPSLPEQAALATGKECITVALLIDKLRVLHIGGVNAEDMTALNEGLTQLATEIPADLQGELAILQAELASRSQGDLPTESAEFDSAVSYFQDWLDQRCNFE